VAISFSVMPWVMEQFFDDNGDPASGYKLFFYAAGTSTKQNVYTDAAGSIAASNPLTLNAAGRPSGPIFWQPLAYKVVLATPNDTDPPTSPIWSADNIVNAIPGDVDVSGVAGAAIAAGQFVYLSDGTGGRTAGAWYTTDADLTYASSLARVVGVSIVTAAAGTDAITVRLKGRYAVASGLTAGTLYYLSGTAGAITSTAPANPRRVAQADTTTSFILQTDYVEPVKGYIPLEFVGAREVVANVIPNIASPASGGILAADTTPALARVNGATDKALRIVWVAGNVDEITWTFSYPPDLDDAENLEVHIMAASAGGTNSPVVAVSYFEGVGDTNAGSNTAAVTGTTPVDYSVTITAANLGAHPNFASVSLVPAAHATDALHLYQAWIEYTRKLFAA